MNGKRLKQLVDISSFSVTDVAKRFNISREHLYKLYQKEDIGPEYTRLANEIGLTKLDNELQALQNVATNVNAEAFQLIERIRADHQRREQELFRIIQDYRQQVQDYAALLRKHKVLPSSSQV